MSTKVSNVRVNTYINDVNAGKSLRQLTNESRKLRNEIALLKPGTQAFIDKTRELQAVEGRLRKVRAEIRGVDGAWGRAANSFNKFAGMITAGAAAIAGFAISVKNFLTGNAELSDAISDVAKTTQLTEAQVKSLMKEMKHMNTRTARGELLALAEIAGRLGIQGEADILGFVRAADKINVSLGDVLGQPEEVMKAIGKMASSFGVIKKMGIEKSMLSIGSALNELGMASTASESYIVEFTKRMAGIAPITGLSIENIMGLGATLDSLGQTSEVSSTALNQLFIKMGSDTATFAKVAGVPLREFEELIRTDMNAAFLKMLDGVQGNSNGLIELAGVLDELGIDGQRVVGVLGTLANNTGELQKQQQIANRSFREGTSVIAEYNLKNENLAALYERLKKAIYSAFVSTTAVDGLKRLVYWATKLVEVPLSESMEESRLKMRSLEVQIYNTNLKQEDRVKLINQLKSLYPQYLGHINAETASNGQLAFNLKKVNEQLVNKIVLQKKDEDVEKKARESADMKMKMLEREEKVRQKMIKLVEESNKKHAEQIQIPEGDIINQAAIVAKRLRDVKNAARGRSDDGGGRDDIDRFRTDIANLEKSIEIERGLNRMVDNLLLERTALMNRLGIKEDVEVGSDVVISPGETEEERLERIKREEAENLRKDEAEKSEAEKRIAGRKAMLEKIKAIEIEFMNEGIEKEMLIIDEKYNKLITDAGVETDLIAELEELKHQEKMRLMEKHLEAEGEMLNRFQEDLADDAVFWSKEQLTQMRQDIVDIQHDMRMASHDLAAESIRGFSQLAQEGSALEEALFIADQVNAVSRIIFNLQQEIAGYAANPAWTALPDGGLVLKAKAITAAKIRSGAGIASVLAQNFTRMQGFAAGGYTGLGFGMPDSSGFKPAGVVHEGEYVVPKWMMQNKWVADITGMLENIRTSKSFAQGGPTATATKVENNYSTNTTTINQETVEALLSTLINEVRANRHVVVGDKAVRDLKTRLDRDKMIDQRSNLK